MKNTLVVLAALAVAVGFAGCATSSHVAPDVTRIDLKQALGPDNQFTDAALGLGVKLPAGWAVQGASRWGDGLEENTLVLKPARATSAAPSIYYKLYTADEMGALTMDGAEVLLREQAMKKEAGRMGGTRDYRNVPESFMFIRVNGRPAMAYLATFSVGGQVMTEHFVRVFGTRGYVMFFTRGKIEDVKAILPELMQAVATVTWP